MSDNELQDFIQDTLRQIDVGASGHDLDGNVEFEVSVAKKTLGDGKVGIEVLGQGVKGQAGFENSRASKISFKINMIRKEELERSEEISRKMQEINSENNEKWGSI